MTAPTSFREAYGTLQRHAETLRNQRDPDLDNLLTVVTESVAAYKVCKTRIEAVEKALEEALSGSGLEPSVSDDQGSDFEESRAAGQPLGARSARRHRPLLKTMCRSRRPIGECG